MTDRFARLAAALLIVGPLAAPLAAQSVELAPGTMKYRLTGATKGTQTTPAGSQDFEVGVLQQITVNLAKTSKDTVKATMTLDSIDVKSQQGGPDLSKLKGANFTAMLSPTGKVYSAKGPDGLDPMLSQVVDGVTRILPTFRSNLVKGFSWSDTSKTKLNQQGMDVERTTVTKFTVAGDTTVAGQKAFKVDKVTSIKAGGMGSMGGTSLTMESEGSSIGAFFITPAGVYLGSRASDSLNTKMSVVGQNYEVVIKQSGTTNVEPIK